MALAQPVRASVQATKFKFAVTTVLGANQLIVQKQGKLVRADMKVWNSYTAWPTTMDTITIEGAELLTDQTNTSSGETLTFPLDCLLGSV